MFDAATGSNTDTEGANPGQAWNASFEAMLSQNTVAAVKDLEIGKSSKWLAEDIKVVKNAAGMSSVNVFEQHFSNPDFWKHVSSNSEYARELYKKVVEADPGSAGRSFTVNSKASDGGLITGTVDPDGQSKIMFLGSDQITSIQARNESVAAGQKVNNALQDLLTATATRTSAVDTAAAEVKTRQDSAIGAITAANKIVDGLFTSQTKALNAVADSYILAGEAKANKAEEYNNALNSIAGGDAVKKLFEQTAAQGLDLFNKEKKAQENLDRVLANPFFGAASYLAGGEDKNPIVQGAKNTVEQIQKARASAIQNSNQLLLGLGQMQGIIDKEFSVATPAEIRADAAKLASDFRTKAAEEQAKQANLPTALAKQHVLYAEAGFKDTLSAAELELRSKIAAVQGATGVERMVATEEARLLRERIALLQAETKLDIADMKVFGGATPLDNSRMAVTYAKLKGLPEGADSKSIQQNLKNGIATKDNLLNLVKVLDSGTAVNPLDKWRDLTNMLPSQPTLVKAYPEFANAISPGEIGYAKWLRINALNEEAVEAAKTAKGEKFNEKGDRPLVELEVRKALSTSQARPEEPVSLTVAGKETKLTGPNPWKILPGTFLAPGENNDSGLSDELKEKFKTNKIAAALAVQEAANKLVPKSSGTVNTIGWTDMYVTALKVKAENPEISSKQVAQWMSDIYKAGGELNNKYLAPTSFGLPEQKNYIVNMEQLSYGKAILKSVMNNLAVGAEITTAAMLKVPPSTLKKAQEIFGTNVAAKQRQDEFSNQFLNPFQGLVATTQVDLFNPVQILNSLMRANPGLWSDTSATGTVK